jgi:hypothetical protein
MRSMNSTLDAGKALDVFKYACTLRLVGDALVVSRRLGEAMS